MPSGLSARSPLAPAIGATAPTCGDKLGNATKRAAAIAATAIARRLGLPKRIVDILEGESLVNDATGLVALAFAVALVVTGERPTVEEYRDQFPDHADLLGSVFGPKETDGDAGADVGGDLLDFDA